VFMTWMLWKALRYPQWKHPIFRQIQAQKPVDKPLAWYWQLLIALIVLAIAAFAIFFPLPALLSLLGLAVGIPALVLVFNGTVLGLYWVSAIAEAIAREIRNGRFELLSLSPDGAFGASWRYAVAVIHRHDWLNTVYRLLRGVVIGTLVVLGFAAFMLILGAIFAELSPQRESQIRILLDVSIVGLGIIFFWIDHIQSIIIAMLVGMLLPYFQRDEALLKLIAPLSFLALQALNYLAAFGFAGIRFLLWQSNFPILLMVLLVVLFYCGIRELLIRALWRYYLRLSHSSEEAKIVLN
jgi:energy-converting hydrogenase Eha subunit E